MGGVADLSVLLINIYQTTRRHIPEEDRSLNLVLIL
jgi:hypothetical protein